MEYRRGKWNVLGGKWGVIKLKREEEEGEK
jgi:hypothetical protein